MADLTPSRPAAMLPPLYDRRVLVVEDEYFVAIDLEEGLQAAGAAVLGPAPTVTAAMGLLEAGPRPDVAVLDINLGGEMAFSLADRLMALGVPMIFATGYEPSILPARLRDFAYLEKPISAGQLVRAIDQSIQAHPLTDQGAAA